MCLLREWEGSQEPWKPRQVVKQAPIPSLLLMEMMTGLKAVVFHLRSSTETLKLYVKYCVHSRVTKDISLFRACRLFFAQSFLQQDYSWVTLTIPSLGTLILFFYIHVLSLLRLQSIMLSVVSELKKKSRSITISGRGTAKQTQNPLWWFLLVE